MEVLQAKVEVQVECKLGEGPVWHPLQQKLYWVDILNCRIYVYDPTTGQRHSFDTGKPVGALALIDKKDMLIALQGEIAILDTENGTINKLVKIEEDIVTNRCNDGKCDPQGRFWIGTMDFDEVPQKGSLYCLAKDKNLTKVLDKLTISNGLDWCTRRNKMYFIDSFDRVVKAYDFDPDSGKITNGKIIIAAKNGQESPDGMCIDREGMLWIAFWGGKRVGRYNPDTGEHLLDVKVPALHVSSCTFGGENLTTLYITTARKGLSIDQLKQYPLSGSVFSCHTGIKGVAAPFFIR